MWSRPSQRIGKETSGTQLNGILGESITFKINESKPFRTISWSRLEKNKSSTVALVTIGKPCKLLVPLPEFKKRVSTSGNCRNLQFSFLRQEDGTRYAADIILTSARTITETFDLKVYKRLRSQDLMIQCMIDGAGQKTLRLNCSAGPWNDSLHLDWHLTAGMSGLRDGSSLVINYSNIRAFDVKVTCEAENPIGKASKTKTLRGACPTEILAQYRGGDRIHHRERCCDRCLHRWGCAVAGEKPATVLVGSMQPLPKRS
ncbi:SLAM family member 5-like isoform 2-T2 [Liasis olivaceus]